MSRLASTARAGYWPTPPRVAEGIARHLTPAPSGGSHVMRLLDPCAGTGDAAATIARALGAESYGIELHAERAEAARTCFDHVLATSAFAVRLAHDAFSCLFLNPPYDYCPSNLSRTVGCCSWLWRARSNVGGSPTNCPATSDRR